MKNRLTETVYQNEHYLIPYSEMGSWFAYMKGLSVFVKDAGNLLIAFSDKFNRYKL